MHLHVDRVVLDGFPAEGLDASRLHAALESELTRLLTHADSTGWTSQALDHLQAPTVHLAPNAGSAAWGRQIARALMTTLAPRSIGDPLHEPAGRQVGSSAIGARVHGCKAHRTVGCQSSP